MLIDTQFVSRVTRNPDILRGKPIIRGTRIPVTLIMDVAANGTTPEDIGADYPDLRLDGIEAALAFAALEQARSEARTCWSAPS